MGPARKPIPGGGEGGGGGEITSPVDFPRTTPPITAVDHSWVLQTTMEIQKSVGKIEASIEALRAETKEHGDKLDKFEKILYATSIVGGIVLVIGGFLINKLWDPLMTALKLYAKTH